MIKEVEGSVFAQNARIICHQVNCRGVMGAGIALEVKKRISDKAYEEYRSLCHEKKSKCLGLVNYCTAEDDNGRKVIIANCFGQDGFGRNDGAARTNYQKLYECLLLVRKYAEGQRIRRIAIPDHMGCGLAGGDWNYVKQRILKPLFENSDIELIIAKLKQEEK